MTLPDPVLIRDIAHARAGDKGDTSNVNVWVYDPADFERLKRGLTAERIKQEFPDLVRGNVVRYVVEHLHGVDFNVLKSDRFVLLGPSGCGKSTLLKAVGGYLRPVEGEIRLKGREVLGPGPDRMMVFQEFDQLLPWKTVLQNVMFPLVSCGKY